MDACPNDGNLLAADGGNGSIKIFDRREGRIVKTFEEVHAGNKYMLS